MRYFNTDAFSIPASGSFGDGAAQPDRRPGLAQLQHEPVEEPHARTIARVSIRIQANNVFNTVQFLAIDTVVNSPTFGQVTSVRPMRSVQLITRFRF